MLKDHRTKCVLPEHLNPVHIHSFVLPLDGPTEAVELGR